MDEKQDIALRASMFKELSQHVAPKRKAVEMSDSGWWGTHARRFGARKGDELEKKPMRHPLSGVRLPANSFTGNTIRRRTSWPHRRFSHGVMPERWN